MEEQIPVPQPTQDPSYSSSPVSSEQHPGSGKKRGERYREKNKRRPPVVAIVVGVVVVAALALYLSDVVCFNHKWIEADCSYPKHCSKCGTEEGEVNPERHRWNNADCTQPRNCGYCGITEGEKNPENHAWEDATCIAPTTCWKCGLTKGDTIGHKYDDGICEVCGISEVGTKTSSDSNVPTSNSATSTEPEQEKTASSKSEQSSTSDDDYSSYEITESEAEEKAVYALYNELVNEAESYTKLDPGSCRYSVGSIEYDSITDSYIVYGQVAFYDKYGGVAKIGSHYVSDWHCYVDKYGLDVTFYMCSNRFK